MVTVLRRSGRNVEELARALGLTDNGIRAHLAVLERDGIAGSRQPPACEKPRCSFEVASADEVIQRQLRLLGASGTAADQSGG